MMIRKARLKKGWSQLDLKERLIEVGVTVPIGSIGHIERKGTTDPKVTEALSWVLEIRIDVLAPLDERKADEKHRRSIRDAISLLKSVGYSVTHEDGS
jgi:ribosome-binding protein aMBF1 (putative translation factor)